MVLSRLNREYIMKSIQVKILQPTTTQPTRLKVFTDENKGFTVSANSVIEFPENVACGSLADQAGYLANKFMREILEWDTDNKYCLVGGSFKESYFFNMVYVGK